MKTPAQRWMDGDDHHPESERLVRAMADMDFKFNGDSMCIKVGGDGDNGEMMMYLLDMVFEAGNCPEPNCGLPRGHTETTRNIVQSQKYESCPHCRGSLRTVGIDEHGDCPWCHKEIEEESQDVTQLERCKCGPDCEAGTGNVCSRCGGGL